MRISVKTAGILGRYHPLPDPPSLLAYLYPAQGLGIPSNQGLSGFLVRVGQRFRAADRDLAQRYGPGEAEPSGLNCLEATMSLW